jgi:hypothetical protein
MMDCPTLGPFECIEDLPAPYADYAAFQAAGGMVTDTCTVGGGLDLGSWTIDADTVDLGNCQYTITRTYSIMDFCGNTETCKQAISIDDQTAPVFTPAPGDLDATFTCSSALVLPSAPTATDNCSGNAVSVTLFDDIITPGACANDYVRVLTYDASDGCGNVSKYIVTLTVADNIAPTWEVSPGALDDKNCVMDGRR